nr:hypothetical protein [uncultured Dyadobacter sp.]
MEFTTTRLVPYGLCGMAVTAFFIIIGRSAVNIPIGDDFYCALLFVQQFQDSPGYLGKLNLLFGQWVEHRIFYSRLIALVSFWLTGQVNFLLMIWIGNLSLVGILFFFARAFRRLHLSGYFLLPVLLTLLSPVMYEGNLWAGASTVYMPVCLMGYVAVGLLVTGTRRNFLGALFTALLATFSFGNGMLVFVAGTLVLLVQRQSRQAFIWIVAGAVAVTAYFTGFHPHSATEAFGVVAHFRHPAYLFYNFFAFVGGVFDYTENTNSPVQIDNLPGIGMGIIEIAVLCRISLLLISRGSLRPGQGLRQNEAAAWLGVTFFLIITALGIAYSRTSGDVMTTLSSRYKIYSMALLLTVYWGLLLCTGRQRLTGFAFFCLSCSLLVFNWYVYYGKMVTHKSSYLAGLHNYHRNHRWLIYRNTSYFERSAQFVSDFVRAQRQPVFTFAPVFPQLTLAALTAATVAAVRLSWASDARQKKRLTIESDSYPGSHGASGEVYLIIYNGSECFVLPASPLRNGRKNMIVQWQYFKPGFYFDDTLEKILRPGQRYQLAIFCPLEKEAFRKIDHEIAL